jgi:hypothetical protein
LGGLAGGALMYEIECSNQLAPGERCLDLLTEPANVWPVPLFAIAGGAIAHWLGHKM